MPHRSDKHTWGDVCQPLVRKETAVPLDQYAVANATRVSKNTPNESTHERCIFLLNILQGKRESRVLCKVGAHLPHYMASHSRRQQSAIINVMRASRLTSFYTLSCVSIFPIILPSFTYILISLL